MCTTNDPFVTYLKQFGYSPIRLPRSNIQPLQVLAKADGDLAWLGDVTELFEPSPEAVLPDLQRDVAAVEISGKRSGELSVGIGVSILGGIIQALAGSKLGVALGFKKARSITFEFPEVLADLVSTIALDKYLALSDVNPAAVSTGRMLEADELFVITSTIKARTFVVAARNERGGAVDVEVPVIQEAVGANVKVEASGADRSRIAFTGATPVIFGFQAVQLFYDQGRYTAIEPLRPGDVAARSIELARSPIDDRLRRFEPEGTFARVRL